MVHVFQFNLNHVNEFENYITQNVLSSRKRLRLNHLFVCTRSIYNYVII